MLRYRALLVFGLTALLAACGEVAPTPTPVVIVGTATPEPRTPTPVPPTRPPAPPTNTAAPLPTVTPIILQGSGIMKTAPFTLAGGNYGVAWVAQAKVGSADGCYHGGRMQAVDPSVLMFEQIGNQAVNAGEQAQGTTMIYNVKPGQYYLNMTSTCDWVVGIVPQP